MEIINGNLYIGKFTGQIVRATKNNISETGRRFQGEVIKSTISGYPIGYNSMYWQVDNFKPYEGEIISEPKYEIY